MNRQTVARSLFVTSLVMAPLCFASTNIVKCVSPNGHVTLTDQPCQGGERSETVLAGAAQSAESAAPVEGAAVERVPAVARATLSRLDPPSRSLARDVATLKAARRAMLLMDGSGRSLRAQRIALH